MSQSPAVVDSHVHFWDPGVRAYPWLGELPRLNRPYGVEDFDRDAAGVPVEAMVFVECNCLPEQALDEARAVSELAARDRRIQGIVAFADLTRPDLLPRLLDEYASLDLVRGVRHNIQGNPPGFATATPFVDGVREVGERGLTFDLCATGDQLGEVVELARLCPGTRLVLDHCGKPDIGAGALEPWRAWIDELASLPHVHCKLSGLLTETGSAGWSDELLLPYTRHVASAFGPRRLLYGGDWPVLGLAGTYREWYQFTRRFTADWEAADQAAFYGGNARRFYRIEAGTVDGGGHER